MALHLFLLAGGMRCHSHKPLANDPNRFGISLTLFTLNKVVSFFDKFLSSSVSLSLTGLSALPSSQTKLMLIDVNSGPGGSFQGEGQSQESTQRARSGQNW